VLVERKGEPHYEMLPYARILASGNRGVEACYDHSDGFYRRLIILKCKDKQEDRKDDRLLATKISGSELPGILNWALVGLKRLMANNWTFTLSEKSKDNLHRAEEEGNNLLMFLKDADSVVYGDEFDVTSGELYDGYVAWCDDNALKPLAMRTVSTYLRDNTRRLGLEYDNMVLRDGKRKRGFRGLKIDGVSPVRVGKFRMIKEG
jgi:putative DNA primase/helicase